jgi:hypothetical protein
MPTVLSIFDRPDDVVGAVNKLKGRGFTNLETYCPAPFPEIDDAVDERPSVVRLFTLIGGLAGVFTGFFIQIWMSWDWPVKIAGKPFASIPPYVIIGFELTILFGGLLTLVGLLVAGRLVPRFKMDPGYSSRFSAEEFGVVVSCSDRDVAEIDSLMRAQHAKEVTLVEED